MLWKMFIFIICYITLKCYVAFIMLNALWLRLNSQDVKWLIIKADVFAIVVLL